MVIPRICPLTASADTGTAFTGTANNDTYIGTLATNLGTGTTLNPGDALAGGAGTDTLNISISGTNTGAQSTTAITLTAIENISVSNFQTADGFDNTIDLSLATGVTGIAVSASASTGDTLFTGVGAIATAAMGNGAGDLSIAYTDAAVTGTADAQTLTLSGQTAGSFTVAGATTGGVETLNIVSQTAANTIAINDAATATITTINVTGASNLTLTEGATNADDAVTTINASAFTGALKVTTGSAAQDMSITGGSGNDTVTLSGNTFSSADSVDGGAGTDTLNVATAITASTDLKNVSNVEVLAITGALNVTLAADVAGLTTIDTTTGSTASTVTFSSGYTAATTVKADATDVIDNSGANAAIAVNFSSDDAVTVTGGTGTDTLNITASSSAVTFDAKITVVDTVTIVDNGDAASGTSVAGEDVTLTLGSYATALTIDASALDAGTLDSAGAMNADWENLTVTGASATKALNITGGAGADTITGGTLNDIIAGGSGNDSISGTAGGADSISGGDGNDTIDMVAALTSADTIDGGAGTDTLSVTSLSASGLTNVTNVETLSLSGASSTATLTANLSFTTIDMSTVDSTAQVLTLSTGYTNATTVSVDAGDKVVNSANVALTVTATAADLQAADGTTITGGTGTDTMTIKADSTTANIVATSGLITLVDVINVTDGGDVTSGTVTAGRDITIDLTSYATATTALTIDASALDSGSVISDVMTNDEVLTITGVSARALNVTGGGGADTIVGSSNATLGDSLTGGAGNDTFTMGTNLTYLDTIAGGTGTDTITVGAITDVAFMRVTEVETVTLAGTATLGTYFDASGAATVNLWATPAAVDASTTSTGHTFVASSVNGAETITGGMGNDTFKFGATDTGLEDEDDIVGGDGTDTIAINNNSDTAFTVVIDLTEVTSVENVTLLDANGDDTTTAESDNVTIKFSGAGDAGNGSAAALADNSTDDTDVVTTVSAAVVTDTLDAVTVDASTIADTDYLFNITGGAGNDTLTGAAAADTISGGDGADSITGGVGADALTGGAGADTFAMTAATASLGSAMDTIADFVTGTDRLAINLGTTTTAIDATDKGDITAASDAIALMSSVVGQYVFNTTTNTMTMDLDGNGIIQASDFALKLTGNTALNSSDIDFTMTSSTASKALTFGAGNDTIVSTGGGSTITGGGGNDSIQGGAAADTISAGDGDDRITILLEAQMVSGSALVDSIVGGAGTDTLSVGTSGTAFTIAAADSWVRAQTVETITAVANTAAVSISLHANAATAGITTVNIAAGTSATNNVINVGAYTAQATTLVGSATGATSITGGAGADTITGGALVDTITGAGGADVISAGAGADKLVYLLTADLFSGSALVDSITGGDGTDILSVGTNAAAFAIAATDVWSRANTVESIVAVANSAAVTIALDVTAETTGIRTVDISLADTVTTHSINASEYVTAGLTLTGAATATTITGGAGADTITGGASTDTLTGGAGADSIVGAGGVDSITGGEGADTITGGAGDDVIVLTETASAADHVVFSANIAANGADAITGFATTVDKLNVDAFGTATALTTVTGVQTNTVNTVYFLGGQAAGAADSIAASVTALAAAGTWTDAAVLSYIIVTDNNSSVVYSYTGDAGANDFTAGELTVMGTVDAVLVAGDILFA